MINIFSGIDEAALGPVLGPYCATTVSFNKKSELELSDIFADLKDLRIDDSKKLYKSGYSLEPLESTALTFISIFLDKTPKNAKDLLEKLTISKESISNLQNIPWYKNITQMKLPVSTNLNKIEHLISNTSLFMAAKNISLSNISTETVPAEKFNSYLNKGLNKSETCQEILTPLIQKSLQKNCRINIDRQGGRRYYGEWLVDIFPLTSISIIKETKEESSYSINDTKINFVVKGDDKFAETSLASIISKYLREILMISFNNYWKQKIPTIKKTAGYPQDGKRFIKDLINNNIDFDENLLIRKR